MTTSTYCRNCGTNPGDEHAPGCTGPEFIPYATPDPDENGPTYVLPERVALDMESAATLALLDELNVQLAALPGDIPVAIDPRPLAKAVLGVVGGDYPQVPKWTGDPRSVGGKVTGEAETQHQEPEIRVDVLADLVHFTIESTGPDGATVAVEIHAEPADAQGWFLAGLAACAAARAHT